VLRSTPFVDPSPRRAVRHTGALTLVVVAAFAVTAPAMAASPAPSAPSVETAGGTVVVSSIHPLSVTLPPGWRLVPSSQEAGSGEDLFEGPGGTATVGTKQPDPGQVVTDRVAANRADLPPDCTSDPAGDLPTTLGGEAAIAWSWRCPDAVHAAVNTIHNGLGYRLTVHVRPEEEAQAASLLEGLRAGFAFTDVNQPEGSPAASADLVTLGKELEGTWMTAWHPASLMQAAVEAAGLSWADADAGFKDFVASVDTVRHAVKLEGGDITQYEAVDGGPLQVGWIGTYELVDGDTIVATESATFNRIEYAFTLRDGILTVDVVDDKDPSDIVPQVAIYETMPFTRVP